MNRTTHEELSDACREGGLLRDFAPLGVNDAEKNRKRREEMMRSLPGRLVAENYYVGPAPKQWPRTEEVTRRNRIRGWLLLFGIVALLGLATYCGFGA
jgi:hypothetical protein